MVMTVPERFAEHSGRIGKLEKQLARIEALLAERLPSPPKPPGTAAPPNWAASGENTGAHYSGPPSVPQTARGEGWVKERRPDGSWKDPSGQWRYASGELVPATIEPRPAGPERDWKHEYAVQTLDNIILRETEK
jgi:hypothetical protein